MSTSKGNHHSIYIDKNFGAIMALNSITCRGLSCFDLDLYQEGDQHIKDQLTIFAVSGAINFPFW